MSYKTSLIEVSNGDKIEIARMTQQLFILAAMYDNDDLYNETMNLRFNALISDKILFTLIDDYRDCDTEYKWRVVHALLETL